VTADGIDEIATFAESINRSQQDIGARRLNTVLHRCVCVAQSLLIKIIIDDDG